MAIDLSLDYHAHILPGCDHGSDSIETSLKQLGMASAVGIKTICATPHFYPHKESVESFLHRRKRSAELLWEHLTDDMPAIHLGAEVLICGGLDHLDGLPCLCQGETNEILLEMPFYQWSESIWDAFYSLCERRDIKIVLAHADRYPRENIEQLTRDGVPIQLNAACLTKPLHRRQYLGWIENGFVKYLGSDIHMLGNGYQNWRRCRQLLEKKFG